MNATELARERTAELAASFGLLTRVPVNYLNLPDVHTADAVWAFPLAGAAVGALGGAVYWLTYAVGCPPALGAICALAAMVTITGALHEDGLADFADGLAGDTKERSLSIMRDHHIGTYGVIALVLALAVRATAVALLADPVSVVTALIAVEAVSRLSAVFVMAALPPARKDGLSAASGRPHASLAFAAFILAFVIALLLLPVGAAMLIVIAAVASAAAIGAIALKRLGGQTGDVLGAASQLCVCLALIGLVSAAS